MRSGSSIARAKTEPRLVRKDLGGLNGFDFGPDGRLCGPLWFRAQVVCLDVDSGALEVVADGFTTPAAANFDPKGELYAIDNATGEVFHIDRVSHKKTRIATAPTNLDNLAFAPDGRMYVTNMPDNAIYEVDRASGAIRTVIASPLTLPGGIARAGNILYVADTFALSAVDLASGSVRDIRRDAESSGSPSVVAANESHMVTASLHRGSAALWDRSSMRVIAQWSELGQPSAIALGAGTRVVVATADGKLIELDAARPETRRVLARGLEMPMGLARSKRGWIVSEAAAGRLVELVDDGTRRTIAIDLAHPEGIALLADGRIGVAETAADRVTLVHSASGRKETIATGLPLGSMDLPGMPLGIFPTGLAIAEDGSLLLSSDVEGGILRLHPAYWCIAGAQSVRSSDRCARRPLIWLEPRFDTPSRGGYVERDEDRTEGHHPEPENRDEHAQQSTADQRASDEGPHHGRKARPHLVERPELRLPVDLSKPHVPSKKQIASIRLTNS